MKINNLIPLAALSLASPAFSQIVIDGTIAGDSYGPAVAVQGTETGFGDNLSEINACYATFEAGRLVFAITGNIEDNFNKLEIFLDTVPGGENVFTAVPGNDNTGVMAGFTFDAGAKIYNFLELVVTNSDKIRNLERSISRNLKQ